MIVYFAHQTPHGLYLPTERLLPRRLVSFADPVARKAVEFHIGYAQVPRC